MAEGTSAWASRQKTLHRNPGLDVVFGPSFHSVWWAKEAAAGGAGHSSWWMAHVILGVVILETPGHVMPLWTHGLERM